MKKILLAALVLSSTQLFSQITIGNANNPVSAIKVHPMLDCNPQLNMVSFVYATSTGGNANKLYANYSLDSGNTWLNSASLLFNNTSLIAPQYPDQFIYNPPLNTVPDSAYLNWLSPAASTSNYQLFRYGSAQVNQLPTVAVVNNGVNGVNIPLGGTITQQGETYFLFPPDTSGSLTVPDSMHIMHGVWDNVAHDMDYTSIALATPLNVTGSNVFRYRAGGIAFANDGLTGYIYLTAHHEYTFNNDSAYYPIIYKTTDGGINWNAPQIINLDNCNSLLTTSQTGKYTMGYEVDAIVDANDNLHLFTQIAPLFINTSMDLNGGHWGLFDIYTINGGSIWNVALVHKPETNSLYYGSGISTYNRAQVARTWSGDHLFFGWFDTDTLQFPGGSNTNPNLFVKGYDVNTQLWTPTVNKTAGTSAVNQCMFGMIAPYVMQNGSLYEVPSAVALGSTSLSASANYRYLNNLMIDSTTFTVSVTPIVLSSTPVGLSNNQNNVATVSEVYPNPATDFISFYIVSKREMNLSYSLINNMGQTIQSVYHTKLKATRTNFHIETKQLPYGIYFLKINTDDGITTKKIIITAY